MSLQSLLPTDRLLIRPLTIHDDRFIFELVNTEGWIKFIGNRNITCREEAVPYIQKILDNQNISYWVVNIKDSQEAIGVITLIKRDYLEHHDIGFAFLPNFYQKGYAYEAAKAVLNELIKQNNHSHILAATLPENIRSITLLKKLGLVFEKEIEVEKQKLHVYGVTIHKTN